MRYTTIAVIYNPNSTGSSEAMAREFKSQVQTHLPEQKVELMQTSHAGHAEELSYKVAVSSKSPLIISSSGDGGYHEVVNGVMKANREGFHATTGVLPAGNANDHHANLSQESLLEQIEKGVTRQIDLLSVTGCSKGKKFKRYAHSYIGLGLTPFVGRELNKTKLNPVKEFFIVAGSLIKLKPVALQIEEHPGFYDSLIFSNVDSMSKYLTISQPSSVDDGKFEVTIFKKRSKLRLIALLLRASVAGIKEDAQVSSFGFKTVDTTLLQADGEILNLDPNTDVQVGIEQQVLNCIV